MRFFSKIKTRQLNFLKDILTTLLYISFVVFSNNTMGVIYMVVLTLAIFIIHNLSSPISRFHVGTFHKYMIMLGLFALASSAWALNSEYAIEKGVTILELLICMSLLYESYCNASVERLLKIVMWAGFLLCIYTIFFVGIDTLSNTLESDDRLDNSFANVNTIGMVGSISILICIYFWMFIKRSFDLMFCLPTVFVVAGSGSRKALVMLIIGIIVLVYYKQKVSEVAFNPVKRFFKIIGSILMLTLTFYIAYELGIFGGTVYRLEQMFDTFTGGDNADSSSLLRAEFRLIGWKQFLETPILGVGFGNARLLVYQSTGYDCYLHCNYAELAANGGIIGLMLYYWVYVEIILREKKRIYVDQFSIILLVIVFLQLIMDYGVVTYYSKNTYFLLMIFMLHINSIEVKQGIGKYE